jgi:hypothetical protein|nr:MAG TPA: hypothetical protein [Caudoviricetes sp.]
MEKYDYLSAVESDVREYIENNVNFHDYSDLDEMKGDLNEKLFVDDSVTGNASGSYTFNAWKAEEYLCHNLDLLAEANEEFGGSSDILSDGAEMCDVTIRCYLLGQAIENVAPDMWQDWEDSQEDSDEEEEIED